MKRLVEYIYLDFYNIRFTMERTVLLYVMLGIFLSITADPVVSSPEENKPQHSEGAAVNFNHHKLVREGALLQLADYVKRGDTFLKQGLQDSYSNLKEQLKQGDELLKERMLEGDAQIKEQLKDGNSRLKDELDEDVAWLTDRISKGHKRLINEMSELNQKINQKHSFEKLKDNVKASSEPSSALIDDLRQQMSDFQAELNSTKQLLQTTRTELDSTRTELDSTKQLLQTTRTELDSTKQLLQTTRTELDSTKQLLQTTRTELDSTKHLLQTTRTELDSTKQLLQTTRTELDSTKQLLQTTQTELATNQHTLQSMQETVQSLTTEMEEDHNSSDSGSTFTRWGRTTCPDNTSLVYTGFAGGSLWNHSGGASNYLCLVTDPQLDNKTAVPSYVNFLYGAEYKWIQGHHNQDAVCSVCRAPQATTLMIPATLTCPAGWTTQYKGHLVSSAHYKKGRTEYVCLDEVREHRVGGDANEYGAFFYYVVTQCGSLPCPPYVQNKMVTCVVCSM